MPHQYLDPVRWDLHDGESCRCCWVVLKDKEGVGNFSTAVTRLAVHLLHFLPPPVACSQATDAVLVQTCNNLPLLLSTSVLLGPDKPGLRQHAAHEGP